MFMNHPQCLISAKHRYIAGERDRPKRKQESRGFPILWMEAIEDVFQMEGKEYKGQEKLKICKRKSMSERGRRFSMG